MEVAYYNLSGGINQALTKTELGIDTKKIYWADSQNVEIFQNRGIVKQKGNSLFLDIGEEITVSKTIKEMSQLSFCSINYQIIQHSDVSLWLEESCTDLSLKGTCGKT